MNSGTAPPFLSYNVDIEAQTQSNDGRRNSRASSLGTPDSYQSTSHSNSESSARKEGRSRVTPRDSKTGDIEKDVQDATETPHTAPQVDVSSLHHDTLPSTNTSNQPEWKPWKAEDPLRTKIPKSQITMEDWVKAMDASDDGMCKGWRDQIDTLIIFAGLFSATVTAFTVESYKWLNETPADTLARLQLRDLLNATRDPAIELMAPVTFYVTSASVAINTLWFASLTLSLAAVVISILCKQWLYEYQRYDGFTTDEAFLIHGLRYQGLQAWRVPEIISSLPIVLQTALVLFLVGILVLLWPLQKIVASITTAIIGLTFLFLVITTALPSIQYIFPKFDTQCAYKSSQSWSFFFISAFWRFDFSEFTSWASFDRWEVACVYNDMGHILSRVYKLLGNSVDVVLSIYSILADKSLRPTIKADLALLPDFLDGLDALGKQVMMHMSSLTNRSNEGSKKLRRIEQLNERLIGSSFRRLRPGIGHYYPSSSNGISKIEGNIDHAYYSRIHQTLNEFLRRTDHVSHPAFFNRHLEHETRAPEASYDITDDGTVLPPWAIYSVDIPFDPEIAMYLVKLHSHLLEKDQLSLFRMAHFLSNVYLGLVASHRQQEFSPPPVTLLKDIQEWVNRVPESDLSKKVRYAEYAMFSLAFKDDFLIKLSESHTSDSEKQYLTSFAHFFVVLYEREEFLQADYQMGSSTKRALAFLREYLDKNPVISS